MTAVASTARPAADAKLLRFALKQDAIGSGANGVVYVVVAAIFGELFGLPAAFLYPIGVFLVAWAATLLLLAARPTVSRAAVGVVMAVNIAWVVASVELLVAGWFPLTGLGTALVIVQAVVVAGFTVLQFAGLRKAG
ncbi:hypothetical protein ONA91_15950 [Micromonospora sp. DR5-3]|uniref:hypothetical protein n=1 Tax=unclassified Micromonospora TaxID=2617518 RepID=UPI0011DC5515|nr:MULTISPECIES: hypothetical protein [unclassified Micromonospora]MCW3815937.1 hypothetical protein [Micromonospora sp. DR5-3]TYC24434.1 hypothetical protein FXF52_10580 [Micromonospora sp. MP36]